MKTPLAVIIFNRPDHAAVLLEKLRGENSRELFIISDGPREGRPGESDKVEKCRAIFKTWPAKKHLNFAERNMGCKARVSTGLTWVFEHTDRAIILEDDCLPHTDFFRFADELLDRYETDTRIMSICGTNLFTDRNYFSSSYCFSKYQNCWGWATWKRSWELFDRELSGLAFARESGLIRDYLGSRRAAYYWHHLLESVRSERINSWAYIWTFTAFLNHGLHIIPQKNLIENIGVGKDSTHTKRTPIYLNSNVSHLEFPLTHPLFLFPNTKLDRAVEDTIFSKSIYQRFLWVAYKLIFR